jgi:subtilisin
MRGAKARRTIEYDFLTRFQTARSVLPSLKLNPTDFFGPVSNLVEERVSLAPDVLGDMEVIDSVQENGPKLVLMSEAAAAAYEATGVGRAVPLRYYELAASPMREPRNQPAGAANHAPIRVTVKAKGDGGPISGAQVIAYSLLAANEGASATTDAVGSADLHLGAWPLQLETVYIAAPSASRWGKYLRNVMCHDGTLLIELDSIDQPFTDCVRQHCAPFSPNDGQGVRIAIIDTGIGPHGDLGIAGGYNSVKGEDRMLIADNGLGHGTHVAGIAAGKIGVAPSAELWSGRVYGVGEQRATNYSIMKAIMKAEDCDIFNLSLSTDDTDLAVEQAVESATEDGAIVIAATGNEGADHVSFPARSEYAIGVSAFGIAGSYPVDSGQWAEVGAPSGPDAYFAAFSNHGSGVRFIGPGVGVVSAALGGGYAVRSGTSMACGAVSGMVARMLSAEPGLLNMRRDYSRSAAIQNLLTTKAKALGFGLIYEGAGAL